MKVAIGPPIENGFYYDFDFPEPIHEDDLERIEAEVAKELAEGREWTREEISRDEAKARFEEEGEPYKVQLVDSAEGDISLYTQGGFTDLCRGPHLQNSKPIKALKLTGPRRRVLARRLDAAAADADLRHRLLLAEGSRRVPRAARGGAQARPPQARRSSSTCSTSIRTRRALRSGIRREWRSGTSSKRFAKRENAARGYVEVKTPLIYDKALWETSGHWAKFREHMFLIPLEDGQVYGMKPMNCPGHMLLFGETLRSYRELPLRYAEAAPLHRNELAGALHGLTRVRHVTQDDAHIFCTQEQIQAELDACVDYLRYLYGLFGLEPRARVFDAAGRQARLGRGVGFHRGRARGCPQAKRDRLRRRRRRRLLLWAEDRPARDRRARPVVAARHDPARPADAAPVRPYLYGGRQHGASGLRHPPGALRIVRALHRHPDRALRGCLPVLACTGPGAGAAGR